MWKWRLNSMHSMVLVAFCLTAAVAQAQPKPSAAGPELLTFEELKALSNTANPESALAAHLERVLETPFVSNEVENRHAAPPHHPEVVPLGPSVRVAFWNIERG